MCTSEFSIMPVLVSWFYHKKSPQIICIKLWGDWFQGINTNLQIRDLNIKVINFQVVIQLQTIFHIGSSLKMTQPAFVLLPVLMKNEEQIQLYCQRWVMDDQLHQFLGPALRWYSCPVL